MVDFRPLKGCRYNSQVVGDLATVICPPYDMIGPELQQSLRDRSPYNAVHLEGGEQPDPVDPEGSYRQAAQLFQDWLGQKALKPESQPAYYLMRHGYKFRGKVQHHLALFGGVRVEEYDTGMVLPHEFTREPAVQDRVKLLKACKAQFSPIMSLYRDRDGDLRPVLEAATKGEPALKVDNQAEGDVTLWVIDDPDIKKQIAEFFAERPVFLADGHHRYEAALRQRQTGAAEPGGAGEYVMMALVEFDDPGLLLLPYHRGVPGLTDEKVQELAAKLDEYFDSEVFPLENGAQALVDRVSELGRERHALAVVGPEAGTARVLTLRQSQDWKAWGPLAISEAWVLEEKVLKPVLGETAARQVDYSHDAEELVAKVSSGETQLAFLLKPFPMDAFEEIVGGGQRLPSKSTFFYPKLPTGLVIHRLEGDAI